MLRTSSRDAGRLPHLRGAALGPGLLPRRAAHHTTHGGGGPHHYESLQLRMTGIIGLVNRR